MAQLSSEEAEDIYDDTADGNENEEDGEEILQGMGEGFSISSHITMFAVYCFCVNGLQIIVTFLRQLNFLQRCLCLRSFSHFSLFMSDYGGMYQVLII